jgi:hypothetical protein
MHAATHDREPDGRRIGLHLIVPVWGSHYVSVFFNTIFPLYFAPGNLPSICNERTVILKIYTSTADLPIIAKSSAYRRACELIEVELIYVDDMLAAPHDPRYGSLHHDVMTRCHKEGLRVAGQQGTAAVVLTADTIFADGALRQLGCLLDEGKRAILVAGPRVVEEEFLTEFTGLPLGPGSEEKAAPRAFTDFCLRHLHPVSRSCFWNESHFFNTHPSHFYWKVEDEGFIAHCSHMHPLMIRPPEKEVQSRNTIDDDYLAHAGFTVDEIHVVTDNLQLPLFSLAPRNLVLGNDRPHIASVAYGAYWSKLYARPVQRRLSRTKVCFYTRQSSSLWEDHEQAAQEALSDIEMIMSSSDFALFWKRPDLYFEKKLFDADSLSFHPMVTKVREYFRNRATAGSGQEAGPRVEALLSSEAIRIFSWHGIKSLAHMAYFILLTAAIGFSRRIRRGFWYRILYPRLHHLVYRKLYYGVIRRSVRRRNYRDL